MKPLVSIIIPAFNAERYIGETIASALAQDWPYKEIIVVDDGSSDNTVGVTRQFDCACLKVITQTNQGACSARNRGFAEAQGEFIQWLDADDLLAPTKIRRQLGSIDYGTTQHNLCSAAWGSFYYRPWAAKFSPDSLWSTLTPVVWLRRALETGSWMPPHAWLMSRRLAEQAGPWDERLLINQDGEYSARVVCAAETVHFCSAAYCYYRRANLGSVSSNRSARAIHSLLLSVDLTIDQALRFDPTAAGRKACVRFLQYIYETYPIHNAAFSSALTNRAERLGGSLRPPRRPFGMQLVASVLGNRRAQALRLQWRRERKSLEIGLDRLLAIASRYRTNVSVTPRFRT